MEKEQGGRRYGRSRGCQREQRGAAGGEREKRAVSRQRGGKDSKEETAGRRLRLDAWRLERLKVYSSIICNISSNFL